MRRDDLTLFVCPKDGAPLEWQAVAAGSEIEEGILCCSLEDTQYSVVRGIPRFVASDSYVASFSFEWGIHRRTQFDNGRSEESEKTFALKTGLTAADLRGKRVLDVGCGTGRYLDIAARWGAECVGIDLSYAIDIACQNLGSRVALAQADVFRLPFPAESFDVIYSLGVLHHTPDTRAAFLQLPRLLKPGGMLAIWVYSAYDAMFNATSGYWRRVTTRLPKRLLYLASGIAIPLYYIYRIPFFGQLLLNRFLPISMHPRASWRVLDTFDWYSPRYQFKHTYPEVARWFQEAGLKDIQVLDVPVSVRGTK
jgi:SAM-dependent methyltransferase